MLVYSAGEPLFFVTVRNQLAFEFFPGIVCGVDCPLGCIAMPARYCSSRGGRPSGDVFVARFLSVWAQVESRQMIQKAIVLLSDDNRN